jgi:GntR family transcriptional repressor for pyruvate dehydrogenase complex
MMEKALHVMQTQSEDLEAVVKADDTFHHAMIEATGNPMFKIMIRPLLSYLHQSRRLTDEHFGVEVVITQHSEVYEAIKARDANKAAEYMQRHIEVSLKHLQAMEEKQL